MWTLWVDKQSFGWYMGAAVVYDTERRKCVTCYKQECFYNAEPLCEEVELLFLQ
jgi:hypothetical protein